MVSTFERQDLVIKYSCSELRNLINVMQMNLAVCAILYRYVKCNYLKMLVFSRIWNIKNSMVWVCERTIPTERLPLVGEVIANFLRIESATWSAWRQYTMRSSVFWDIINLIRDIIQRSAC
jgi:hypothetical protein